VQARDAACLVSGCGAIFHGGDPPNAIAARPASLTASPRAEWPAGKTTRRPGVGIVQ